MTSVFTYWFFNTLPGISVTRYFVVQAFHFLHTGWLLPLHVLDVMTSALRVWIAPILQIYCRTFQWIKDFWSLKFDLLRKFLCCNLSMSLAESQWSKSRVLVSTFAISYLRQETGRKFLRCKSEMLFCSEGVFNKIEKFQPNNVLC